MAPSKFIGICGILAPIIIFSFIIISILGSPGFHLQKNWLSDLGTIGFYSIFFNFGLILGGFFGVIFSLFFRKKTPIGYIILISMISLIVIGLFPSNLTFIHIFFTVLFFLTAIISMFITGILEKNIRYLSFFLVIISVISWLPCIDLGVGAIREIITGLCFGVFIIILGFRMLKK